MVAAAPPLAAADIATAPGGASLSVAQVWRWLEEVMDPEIPVVSVVDLGIVRAVAWRETAAGPTLFVTITPTYSGCPATEVIAADIKAALVAHGVVAPHLEISLAPAWTTDWLSAAGRARLKAFGIAPPASAAPSDADAPSCPGCALAVSCPHCGEGDTRIVSRFGSTPCKAHYVCNRCLEPFDYFKPH